MWCSKIFIITCNNKIIIRNYYMCFYMLLPQCPILLCRYLRRPSGMSGVGLYDPTEVMNRAQLSLYTREGFVKIGFYVVSFLVYLYK